MVDDRVPSVVTLEEVARLVWTLPVAIGVDVKNPLTLTAALTTLRTSAMLALPGALTWAPLEKEYKGVSIVRVQATPERAVDGARLADEIIEALSTVTSEHVLTNE